jgi:hypothetical protein
MSSWEAGARRREELRDMPVLIEQYVVGDLAAARQAGEYWRFGPNAWSSLHKMRGVHHTMCATRHLFSSRRRRKSRSRPF